MNKRIISGKLEDNEILSPTDSMVIESGGVANGIIAPSGAELYVLRGASATGIEIKQGAMLCFEVAPNTFVQGGTEHGCFETKDGHLLNHSIGKNEEVVIRSGGTAINTFVTNSGYTNYEAVYLGRGHTGQLSVCNGGVASGVLVDEHAILCIYSGGTATEIRMKRASRLHFAVAPNTHVQVVSGFTSFETNNGVISGLHFNNQFSLYVASGGTASDITLKNGAGICFDVAPNTLVRVLSGNQFIEMDNGIISGYTTDKGEDLTVLSGGTAINTVVNGEMNVSSGGTAINTIAKLYNKINVFEGGIASNVVVSAGDLTVHSGGTATEVELKNGKDRIGYKRDFRFIFDVAPDTCIQARDGKKSIEMNNGDISSQTLGNGMHANILVGGKASGVCVKEGFLNIESGGETHDVKITNDGRCVVRNGGKASGMTIGCDGSLKVFSGGTATDVSVMFGGRIELNIAPNTYAKINLQKSEFELKDGVYSNSIVPRNWQLQVCSGGTIKNAIIYEGAMVMISSGGTAVGISAPKDTLYFDVAPETYVQCKIWGGAIEMKDGYLSGYTVKSKNSMTILSGGTAEDLIVKSGGKLIVSSGGTALNPQLGIGAEIETKKGAVVTYSGKPTKPED